MIDKTTPPSQRMKGQLSPSFPILPNPLLQENLSIFLIGSCFSDAMVERFQQRQIKAFSNPFGTIYHPTPILNELKVILNAVPEVHSQIKQAATAVNPQEELPDNAIFEFQERFHSLQHAFRFSSTNREDLVNQIQTTRTTAAVALSQASVGILTLGTSWLYHHLPTQTAVGNCHKLPAQQFNKQCSTVNQIKEELKIFFDLANNLLPEKVWILTVSPVRHIKDGISENLRSKSTLICGIQEFLNENPSTNIHYFPAYEIQREELNDWRYFKEDLMHPSAWAEDYIFQRFLETYFTEESQSTFIQNFKQWKLSQHNTNR